MMLVRFLANLLIFVIEIAAIAGVAWLGYHQPLACAALAAGLALAMGFILERARLRNEIGFYFGRSANMLSIAGAALALGEALVKAVLAGVVTLLTFSGTDQNRLFWVAIIFAGCLFGGTSLLRRLALSFGVIPARWGYFRLAAPLGLLFSAAVSFLPHPSTVEIGRRLLLETPERPTFQQASELLFLLKQKFDEIVVSVLSVLLPPEAAKLAGILVSVNMLTGFAVGVFAVAIAEMVRRMEQVTP
jgi:hypothetical protein